METFWTFEMTSTDYEIQKARRLTEEEKPRYTPEYQNLMMIGFGERYKLDVSFQALDEAGLIPDRLADGTSPGCWNKAWIITEEEKDAYLRFNHEKQIEKLKQNLSEKEEYLKMLEAKLPLPTREEARKRMLDYNNTYNDGGEGYVPYIYSQPDYELAKRAVEKAKDELEQAENTQF